ncbi:MAG: acyl-CoA dehydrogenase family protein [Pseudomonadota bacterium]
MKRTLTFTEVHDDFRSRLRDFLSVHVAPHTRRWEVDGMVPRHIWRQMGENGFLCAALPPEYGGLGGDFRYGVIVIEELARIGQNGLAAPLHSDIVVPYISSYGTETLKAAYLPGCADGSCVTAVAMTEPGAGSDLSAMSATAVEDGDEIVINGAKTFISNGLLCDLVVVAAKDPDAANPYEAISLFVVEDGTPGFNKGQKLKKMGLESQDTAELFFSDCRIPAVNRLGTKGGGFLMLMEKLQQERLVVAVWAVAAARYVSDWLMTHREALKQSGRIGQAAQFALVEMATETTLGQVFIDALVTAHMAGDQVVGETSMAKYWTTDMAKRICDRGLDLLGTTAAGNDHPVARMFRDMRVMSIFAGTNEIMKGIAAKCMGL